MDERRGLQRVGAGFQREATVRQAPQIAVETIEEGVGRVGGVDASVSVVDTARRGTLWRRRLGDAAVAELAKVCRLEALIDAILQSPEYQLL